MSNGIATETKTLEEMLTDIAEREWSIEIRGFGFGVVNAKITRNRSLQFPHEFLGSSYDATPEFESVEGAVRCAYDMAIATEKRTATGGGEW